MDETKKGQQDSLPEKGQTSKAEPGTTPGGEPETFTKEQAQKQVSDALAAAGRDAKSLETRGKDLDAREVNLKAEQERITQWQKERDAEQLEAARDNPQLLDQVQQKRQLRDDRTKLNQDRAEFERDKAEHKGVIDAASATQREITIWDIAQKNGVDAANLKDKCDKFNLQSNEQMEEMAKTMSGTKPAEPLKPDSGETTGGGKDLSGKSPMQLAREAYSK